MDWRASYLTMSAFKYYSKCTMSNQISCIIFIVTDMNCTAILMRIHFFLTNDRRKLYVHYCHRTPTTLQTLCESLQFPAHTHTHNKHCNKFAFTLLFHLINLLHVQNKRKYLFTQIGWLQLMVSIYTKCTILYYIVRNGTAWKRIYVFI